MIECVNIFGVERGTALPGELWMRPSCRAVCGRHRARPAGAPRARHLSARRRERRGLLLRQKRGQRPACVRSAPFSRKKEKEFACEYVVRCANVEASVPVSFV